MTCQAYIEEFLTAHADGELSAAELAAAGQHVMGCPRCAASLAEQHRLKSLVRSNLSTMRVPADLRLRLRAAVGIVVGRGLRAERAGVRSASARGDGGRNSGDPVRSARWITARPLRAALPLAAAAILVLTVALKIGGPGTQSAQPDVPPTPFFDLAVASYDGLAGEFTPNVSTESPRGSDNNGAYFAWVVDRGSDHSPDELRDLEREYHDAGVPEEIYDFSAAGYAVYGGRLDQSVDGWPMTYTLYRGGKGEILSVCLHAKGFAAPVGASYWAGSHTFFAYKDHSLCLTFGPSGHFISIMVSREPVADLLRDVTLSDSPAS